MYLRFAPLALAAFFLAGCGTADRKAPPRDEPETAIRPTDSTAGENRDQPAAEDHSSDGDWPPLREEPVQETSPMEIEPAEIEPKSQPDGPDRAFPPKSMVPAAPEREPVEITVTDDPAMGAADGQDERSPPERALRTAPAEPGDRGFTRVRVFYATDRKRSGSTPNEFYGSERAMEDGTWSFQFGRCDVSIPYAHRPGEVERPSIWKFEFTENPARHVVLLSVNPIPMNECLATIRQEVDQSAGQSAFVFVHGFNVAFADAARRTAQMKHDLGFDGAALMYSWPAPKNYVECEGNAVWTRPHLVEFLTNYVQKSGATRIHLIAHSMGTRVLSNALKELVQAQGDSAGRYNEIILAAPDIDATVFRDQIAPRIVNTADRISIYSSSKDLALVASKRVHKYVRLGEGGPYLTVFPRHAKIDVVDASGVNESVLGHSYYGNSPTILRDVRLLLAGAAATKRGLERRRSHFLFPSYR